MPQNIFYFSILESKMTYSTDSLKNEAGIQFDEVILIGEDDKQVIGLIAGQFKRGRMDKPMTVTLENIRSVLGYDPRNPDYAAVVDVLNFGIPSVQVMRITGDYYNYDEPEFGPWAISSNVSISSDGIARYTASKTNKFDWYDSYADFDLVTALVRSFHDADMQQWQAVKDAANQLTGVTNWTFDIINQQIKYVLIISKYKYNFANYYQIEAESKSQACDLWSKAYYGSSTSGWSSIFIDGRDWCVSSTGWRNNYITGQVLVSSETQSHSIHFSTLAQKILSNTLSTDQGISLLAEAYRENVAKSLFNTDTAKQFVKLDDLISLFEQNQVLRK